MMRLPKKWVMGKFTHPHIPEYQHDHCMMNKAKYKRLSLSKQIKTLKSFQL